MILEALFFGAMLRGAKYISDSQERSLANSRRDARKAFGKSWGAGRRRNSRGEGYWHRRYREEKRGHGKTKQEKKRALGAAKESQRLHEGECRDHERTRQHYDAGLISLIKTTWTPKTRMGALLKLVRAHINSIRSSKVPARSKRKGKIR